MVIVRQSGRGAGGATLRALDRRLRHVVRRLRESETLPAIALVGVAVLIGVGQYLTAAVPPSALLLPMVVGNLVLGPRSLPWAVVSMLGVLVLVVAAASHTVDDRRIGGVVVTFLCGMVILVSSFRRTSLGVAGVRGETMLVDLRDRINRQARMPALPAGWYAESVMRSAGGASFAGDFMVGSLSSDGRRLQVAVVDVSGKGVQAGSRSLLLSGAFGGLLAALPPAEFLPAANDYLLRQDWSEGFATAVHLAVDLDSGTFEVRSAGHPPAAQLVADTGRWAVHEASGPVLGLIEDAEFTTVGSTLGRGDVLLLFTDGLVETPQRDIRFGIDKLLGLAERDLRAGVPGGAERLVERVTGVHDDRALVLLHRRV
jgi:hypothetical protein